MSHNFRVPLVGNQTTDNRILRYLSFKTVRTKLRRRDIQSYSRPFLLNSAIAGDYHGLWVEM